MAKRILILDEPKTRKALEDLLDMEGYQVTTAGNGFEATSLHQRDPFDLVILELGLGENNGFATLRELQREPAGTKFIAMANSTWLPTELTLKMARQMGVHETLEKPLNARQTLAAVRKVLGED